MSSVRRFKTVCQKRFPKTSAAKRVPLNGFFEPDMGKQALLFVWSPFFGPWRLLRLPQTKLPGNCILGNSRPKCTWTLGAGLVLLVTALLILADGLVPLDVDHLLLDAGQVHGCQSVSPR